MNWDTIPPPPQHTAHSARTHQKSAPYMTSATQGASPNDHKVNITLTLQTNPNAPHGGGQVSVTPDVYGGGAHTTTLPYSDPYPQQPIDPRGLPDGGAPPGVNEFALGGLGLGAPAPPGMGHGGHGDVVSRSEIEQAFSALENKLTESQRQDALVLESKLDQLLGQMRNRQEQNPRSSAAAAAPALQHQLRDIIGKIDSLATSPPAGSAGTQPAPHNTRLSPIRGAGGDPSMEALVNKVNALESQLDGRSSASVMQSQMHAHENDFDMKDHSRKTAELDVVSHPLYAEQQQRYVRDVQQLQRKISELETRGAVGGAVHHQHQHHPQAGGVSAPPSSAMPMKQPLSAGYHIPGGAANPNSDLKSLQDEIEELRRRDDLSRKVCAQKGVLGQM